MKAAEKKILTAFLEKSLTISTEEVAQLFTENGEESDLKPDADKTLLAFNAAKIKELKEEGETKFLNGQKKATKEFGVNRDKEIKEKFGIESDKIGLELIEDLLTIKTDATKLDAEKIKVHPEYLKREKELLKKATEDEAAWKKKMEDRDAELAEKETLNEIFAVTDKMIREELKFALPENETIAKNQMKLMHDALKANKFQGKGPDSILLKADGSRLEDEQGKPVTLRSFVEKEAAKYWEPLGDERSGAGAGKESAIDKAKRLAEEAAKSVTKKKWAGAIPKTADEFSKVFPTLTSDEDRVAYSEAYEATTKV